MHKIPPIFYLNVGRSGSMTMAKARGILHEPDGSFPSTKKAKKRMRGTDRYGETSHFWKAHIKELKEAFPNGTFLHLLRNGKDVTKSFYCATRYYSNDPRDDIKDFKYRNEPLPLEGFDKLTRFEKICWYWRYWNEIIEKETIFWVRIEDMNYSVFNNSYNKKKEWTDEMEGIFERICGDLNRKYGY